MGRTFELTVMTPEREFFSGEAEALSVTGVDGEFCVLAGHAPMVATLEIGTLRIQTDGEWREAINSEGFMEVLNNRVVVFVQTCEWPEEIDVRRAEQAKRRAEELLRQKQNLLEYGGSKIALARAMARLSASTKKYRI